MQRIMTDEGGLALPVPLVLGILTEQAGHLQHPMLAMLHPPTMGLMGQRVLQGQRLVLGHGNPCLWGVPLLNKLCRPIAPHPHLRLQHPSTGRGRARGMVAHAAHVHWRVPPCHRAQVMIRPQALALCLR